MMRRIGATMRTPAIALVAFASVASAQEPGGVWTGYVGGWKSNAAPVNTVSIGPARNPMLDWPRQRVQPRPVVFVPYYVGVNTTAAVQQTESQRAAEQAEQRRAWEAEQTRLAQQTQLDNERRLAAEREAMLQQQLENERRLAAEREALAAERLRIERDAARAVLPPPPMQPPAPPPAEPRTPGNDIYRWTDADGVVHYSTRVPEPFRGVAKKVGGSR